MNSMSKYYKKCEIFFANRWRCLGDISKFKVEFVFNSLYQQSGKTLILYIPIRFPYRGLFSPVFLQDFYWPRVKRYNFPVSISWISFWPRPMLKGPKRSCVVLVVLGVVETWAKKFQIEQKIVKGNKKCAREQKNVQG